MQKKVIWSIVVIVALLIIVPAAWYFLSPLFIDNVVSEDLPPTGSGSSDNSQDSQDPIAETLYSGSFVDADSFHKTSGTAKVIEVSGEKYLRLENFESTNGPDLKVYLSSDLKASDYTSLGDLKGNIGDQNYLLPGNIDLETQPNVLIWCEQFSVLFGSAELS